MDKIILFQGKKISYTASGSGSVLLFLHGFIESKRIWDAFASELSAEFTVITVDLPGHGKTEVVAEVHTMALMAEVVNSVLTAESVDKAVMIGHSMGGYVSLEFGERYPGKLLGMVLFHSQAAPDTEQAKENRRRTIDIVRKNRGGFIRQFIPDLFDPNHLDKYTEQIKGLHEEAGSMSPDAIIAAIAGMRDRKGGLDFLSSAIVPFLFILGKQDSRIPYRMVLDQAVIPTHSEVLLLEDVGHMGYIEAPIITLQAIRYFALRCFGK